MGSRLTEKVKLARASSEPWPHIELSGFLDETIGEWPIEGFTWLKHSDIVKPDGTSLRKYWFLADVFPNIAKQLLSKELEQAFKEKFGLTGDLYPQALLIEDLPGYKIRRHTDCAGKVITCQIYFAEDEEHHDQGVILQDRDGFVRKQIPYSFNSGYAFKVTKYSWHRVLESKTRRRSIQLIYYSVPNPTL